MLIRPMGRTDEGAKRPVTRRSRLLVVRCGVSSHHCCLLYARRFLAECHMRQLNQGSFVLVYFGLFTFLVMSVHVLL